MAYPIITDYKNALRNFEGRFATLKPKPFFDHQGEPIFWAGNFAVVFKAYVEGRDEAVAIKCFINDLPDLEKRHRGVSLTIDKLKARYLIDVQYIPDELYVTSNIAPSGDYPVLVMPWVEGETLGAVIERQCVNQNRRGLAAITKAWANLCLDMLGKKIAHGDLKHDNVLITTDGQLRLIDYDSMFVPALAKFDSIAIGGPSYQHPRRDYYHFDKALDHFSMLVIILSLRALIVDPSLYETYNTGQNMIFTADDFVSGGRSALFMQLRKSPDPVVREWTELLIKVMQSKSIAVPRIERILKLARKTEV
ncbi:Putative Serine/threonine protein kinase [Candidatus Terasakiella magnetica]|uniref:Serine/threonine protein kinase n=1 Tax=Candidatus Terasakiella magnetica TaxID=1867952 RepID=A0A1C3RH33_9PROT|nr:protein kinase family protein [Candidatus Terasakiella magnetica]SCA56603.1 Putative Serine/threonine protein kinase [Candidatus Terasakiella magnetica]